MIVILRLTQDEVRLLFVQKQAEVERDEGSELSKTGFNDIFGNLMRVTFYSNPSQ